MLGSVVAADLGMVCYEETNYFLIITWIEADLR
jgi:hypothetical protein